MKGLGGLSLRKVSCLARGRNGTLSAPPSHPPTMPPPADAAVVPLVPTGRLEPSPSAPRAEEGKARPLEEFFQVVRISRQRVRQPRRRGEFAPSPYWSRVLAVHGTVLRLDPLQIPPATCRGRGSSGREDIRPSWAGFKPAWSRRSPRGGFSIASHPGPSRGIGGPIRDHPLP